MAVKFTRGTITKRSWLYCPTHERPVTDANGCAACPGKKSKGEAFLYFFVATSDGAPARRVRGQAPTREAAIEAMEQKKAELAKEPEVPAAPVITFGAYAEKWLAGIGASIEGRTVESYRGQLRVHVLPAFSALPLAGITRGQVKDLLASKRSGGLAKNSVRLIRATISALYADAMDDELVAANPAARTGRAKGRKAPDTMNADERRQQVKALDVPQLATFLKAAQGHRLHDLFLLLVDTGLRPGEALALRWTDLDLVGRTVTVERAVERGGKIKGTKTGTSRTVDLTSRLAKVLSARQAAAEAEALANDRDPAELVFPSEAGTPLDGINVASRFRSLLVKAGLPRFPLYATRHTFASHLLMMGAPITYVSAQLGHAKPVMTLQAYAHYLPRGDRAWADRLETWRANEETAPARV